MRHGIKAALVASALCAVSSSGFAQDAEQETGAVELSASTNDVRSSSSGGGQGRLRITGGLHFGGGGEVQDTDADEGFDLDPIVGLQGGVDFVVMDYFAIGGEMRFSFPKGDGADDRGFFWDLNAKPRGRYQFGNIPLEVYGTMPLGLSVVKWPDVDGSAGFNLGFGPGATYFFTDMIGINSELLGVWHWWGQEYESIAGTVDSTLRTAQFYFAVNAVIAL